MKKFNKEKLIKKVNKIYQLEDEKNLLSSNLKDMYKEIANQEKILEDNQKEYDRLISDVSIEELNTYPASKIDELMANLTTYSKSIEKLRAARSKIFKKYQKIGDKVYKLRHSR